MREKHCKNQLYKHIIFTLPTDFHYLNSIKENQ